MEIRPIPGHPGYFVSDDGRVFSECGMGRAKSKYGWPRRELRPGIAKEPGYPFVVLSGKKGRFVHRLVLETFVGPRPHGMEARHLDGDRTNNRVENLRWGTRKENVADAIKHGTFRPVDIRLRWPR